MITSQFVYYHFVDCSSIVKDVVFMVETSRSIGSSRFQLVRELIKNITIILKVNSPESLVGLITFDDIARVQFNISTHTDLSTLLPAINPGLPYYKGFLTNTASALKLLLSGAREGGFLGLRKETSNVAIVITDGFSIGFSSLQSAANSLHATNIFDVYAVGIGSNRFSELQLIASDPSFIFSTSFLSSFTAQQLEQDVVKQLCSSKCFVVIHMYVCNCDLICKNQLKCTTKINNSSCTQVLSINNQSPEMTKFAFPNGFLLNLKIHI